MTAKAVKSAAGSLFAVVGIVALGWAMFGLWGAVIGGALIAALVCPAESETVANAGEAE